MTSAKLSLFIATQNYTMEMSVKQELCATLEDLTHSGRPSLDQQLLKQVKGICKQSDSYVRVAYETLMNYLAKDHAEIRLSSFQAMNEIFRRSHLFRELLTSDFQRFVSLSCGSNDDPLPPPSTAASRLKEESVLAIRQWVEKFGEGYPKLKIGFNFLKHTKKVDFDDLQLQSEAQQRRIQQREEKHRALVEQRVAEVHREMAEQENDIQTCLTEMESCFQLLLPRFDLLLPNDSDPVVGDLGPAEFESSSGDGEEEVDEQLEDADDEVDECNPTTDEDEVMVDDMPVTKTAETSSKTIHEEDSDDESEEEWEEVNPDSNSDVLQAHGIAGHSYSLTIELPKTVKVVENEENSSIISTLKERHHLVASKFLPAVNKWIQWFTKAGQEESLKQAIDLKGQLTAVVMKYSDLSIVSTDSGNVKSRDDEQVEQSSTANSSKPSSSSHSISDVDSRSLLQSYCQSDMKELELDPTTPQAQIAILRRKRNLETTAISSRPKIAATTADERKSSDSIPILPYDVDLYSWGNSDSVEPVPVQLGSFHRFLSGNEPDMIVNEEQKARMKHRTIAFTGKFEPVKRACRAPLPSGRLCPRMDRHKCPFHGPIVPRDDNGRCLESTASSFMTDPCEGRSSSDTPLSWRDLVDDVCEAQGLNIKEKKRKGPKKKHPGLTDIAAKRETPRRRVEKKIMKPSSLKRVATSLNEIASKVGQEKFADNFNYALKH